MAPRYAAVPEAALRLDGYPSASDLKATGATASGLKPQSLRLLLYPMAWRFYSIGLDKLLGESWPSTRGVQQSGFLLSAAARAALDAKLASHCPPSDPSKAGCTSLHTALRERHWPAAALSAAPESPAGVASPILTREYHI